MPDFSGFGTLVRSLHNDARNFVGSHLGSGPVDDPGSRNLHSNVMEKLTKIGGYTPGGPLHAGALALLAGMENELVGGATELMQGRPFVSDKGFDPVDLDANLRGVTAGLMPNRRKMIPPR